MINFEEYSGELKKLYPNYSDEQLEKVFELRVNFWE